jgi:hypothetical protein
VSIKLKVGIERHKVSIGRELARYVIGLTFEDLLPDVVHQTKRVRERTKAV